MAPESKVRFERTQPELIRRSQWLDPGRPLRLDQSFVRFSAYLKFQERR